MSHFNGAALQLHAGTWRCRRGLTEVCYGLIVYLGSLSSTSSPTPLGRKLLAALNVILQAQQQACGNIFMLKNKLSVRCYTALPRLQSPKAASTR